MQLVSVNVGMPRQVTREGKRVTTGIFKVPVRAPVWLGSLKLDGDGQADLEVHGGKFQAAYVYPSEHYAFWRYELPGTDLPWGMFGENLTSEGLLENDVHIGDELRIGEALVRVTAPRLPCYKLGIKFGRPDMVKRFLDSGRTGFYLLVAREGRVEAGDAIQPLRRDPHGVTVADFTRLHKRGKHDLATMRRLLQVDVLPDGWRRHFEKIAGA